MGRLLLCLVVFLSLSVGADVGNLSADESYERGLYAYESANCTNGLYFVALGDFEEVRSKLREANDSENLQKVDYIINRTKEAIVQCASSLIKDLGGRLFEAESQIILAPFNCSRYDELEGRVLGARNDSLKFYGLYGGYGGGFINLSAKCDKLLESIRVQKVRCLEVERAERLYGEVVALYSAGDCRRALSLARNLSRLQTSLSDWAGRTKLDFLIDDINLCVLKLDEADSYYNSSVEHYHAADFVGAFSYVLKAKGGYAGLNRSGDVALCDKLIADIEAANATKSEADRLFSDAVKYYEVRDFAAAHLKADAALGLYRRINDSVGVAEVEFFLKNTPKESPPKGIPFTYILIFVSLIVFIVFFVYARRKKHVA